MNCDRQRKILICFIGTIGLLAGCSKSKPAAVSPDKARETLKAALESWKKGDKVDALQSASPPIYVIDVEWQAGAVLKDFKLVNDGETKDAHLFCPVKITVRDSSGKETQQEVIYVIATAPKLVVSRKMF
jgi:hypothetical protein